MNHYNYNKRSKMNFYKKYYINKVSIIYLKITYKNEIIYVLILLLFILNIYKYKFKSIFLFIL